jgi:hypothetical protein
MPTSQPPEGQSPPGGREPFFTWFAKKPLAWVFTGIGGLGLIGTIGFGAAAGSAGSAKTSVQDQILDKVKEWENSTCDPKDPKCGRVTSYEGSDPTPCGPQDGSSPDQPYYSTACNQLRDNISAYNTDVALSVVSAVLLGGGIIADIVYYFVDTAPSPSQTSGDGPRIVGVGPIVTPTQQGFGLVGTF